MSLKRVCRFRNGKTGEIIARLCYEIDHFVPSEQLVKGVASVEVRITAKMQRLYEECPHLRYDGIDFILTMHDPAVDGEWICTDVEEEK